jgi:glucosylglycerate phosphorylase
MRSMTHPKSKKYRINQDLGRMIQARTKHRAFHPNGPQKILSLSPAVLAVTRTSPEGDRVAVTLTNVTKFKHRVEIPLEEMNGYKGHWQDLLSENEFSPKKERLSIPLQPYDVLWLVPHT